MNPVDLVDIHHEGDGTPSDVPRGAKGGYTYWIGASRWTHLRTVWVSFATLHYNHVSLDICLSGDRMKCAVTDSDIQLIHAAFMDARQRGYVTANPTVRPHKLSPGSHTVCPGDNTMARWNDVVLACRDTTAPTPHSEEEMAAYPSRTKKPDRFRGAIVDRANKHVTLANAAECDPSPAVIPTNQPWIADYSFGPGKFMVVLADNSEYGFDLP